MNDQEHEDRITALTNAVRSTYPPHTNRQVLETAKEYLEFLQNKKADA